MHLGESEVKWAVCALVWKDIIPISTHKINPFFIVVVFFEVFLKFHSEIKKGKRDICIYSIRIALTKYNASFGYTVPLAAEKSLTIACVASN